MFILIQSRQWNISMWFTLRDQSQIPALNIWNSSSCYLQQTGQDQFGDKKGGFCLFRKVVEIHCWGLSVLQHMQWHSQNINTCACAWFNFFLLFKGCFFFRLATICFSSHVSSLYICLSSRQWIQDRFSCQGIPLPNENKWIKHKRSSFKLKIERKKNLKKTNIWRKTFFPRKMPIE